MQRGLLHDGSASQQKQLGDKSPADVFEQACRDIPHGTTVLKPGDVIYIPRGWPHQVAFCMMQHASPLLRCSPAKAHLSYIFKASNPRQALLDWTQVCQGNGTALPVGCLLMDIRQFPGGPYLIGLSHLVHREVAK